MIARPSDCDGIGSREQTSWTRCTLPAGLDTFPEHVMRLRVGEWRLLNARLPWLLEAYEQTRCRDPSARRCLALVRAGDADRGRGGEGQFVTIAEGSFSEHGRVAPLAACRRADVAAIGLGALTRRPMRVAEVRRVAARAPDEHVTGGPIRLDSNIQRPRRSGERPGRARQRPA